MLVKYRHNCPHKYIYDVMYIDDLLNIANVILHSLTLALID